MSEPYHLAVDIGGTKISAAAVRVSDGAADIVLQQSVPTRAAAGADVVLTQALDLVADIHHQLGGTALGVGIASAGVVDPSGKRITHATSALPGWPGTEITQAFQQRFAVPAVALNDVHAHGLGESFFGAGRGTTSMLLLAVGTGIGGCVVGGDGVIVGAHGAAGHIGHMPSPEANGIFCSCGRMGHLEGLASGPGILKFAPRIGCPPEIRTDGHTLALAAAQGHPCAVETYRYTGFATGRIIGGLLNALDVEVVVVTGGVSEVGEFWWGPLRDGVRHDAMDVVADTPVVAARAGVHAALLGAAAHASRTTPVHH